MNSHTTITVASCRFCVCGSCNAARYSALAGNSHRAARSVPLGFRLPGIGKPPRIGCRLCSSCPRALPAPRNASGHGSRNSSKGMNSASSHRLAFGQRRRSGCCQSSAPNSSSAESCVSVSPRWPWPPPNSMASDSVTAAGKNTRDSGRERAACMDFLGNEKGPPKRPFDSSTALDYGETVLLSLPPATRPPTNSAPAPTSIQVLVP